MIKGIAGYNEAQAVEHTGGELPKLEPGGYVLRIMAVKVEDTQWGARLAFQFDIAEGEQKGFFKKLYDATPNDWESKKWKGSYRLFLPQNKGDEEKYKKSVGFFKGQLEAFEKSNSGLKVNASGDWDEQIFKGKFVGALFNEKEWAIDGKTGFFTQCKRFVSAVDIRSGNYKIPKPDKLKPNTTQSQSVSPFMAEAQAQTQTQMQAADTFGGDFEIFNDDGVPF